MGREIELHRFLSFRRLQGARGGGRIQPHAGETSGIGTIRAAPPEQMLGQMGEELLEGLQV